VFFPKERQLLLRYYEKKGKKERGKTEVNLFFNTGSVYLLRGKRRVQ